MFDFLVGDYGILFGVLILIGSAARIFPNVPRTIWLNRNRFDRWLGRSTIVIGAVGLVWMTAIDNWRKILGVPSGWFQDEDARIASDPFYAAPISDTERLITWVLFGLMVVGGAFLFVRLTRGYIEPLLLGPLALITFFVTNTFRLRMDVDSVRIAFGSIDGPLEILSTSFWVAGLVLAMGVLVVAMYLVLWAPAALIIAIVYRLIVGPEKIVEAPIFKHLKERGRSNLSQNKSSV